MPVWPSEWNAGGKRPQLSNPIAVLGILCSWPATASWSEGSVKLLAVWDSWTDFGKLHHVILWWLILYLSPFVYISSSCLFLLAQEAGNTAIYDLLKQEECTWLLSVPFHDSVTPYQESLLPTTALIPCMHAGGTGLGLSALPFEPMERAHLSWGAALSLDLLSRFLMIVVQIIKIKAKQHNQSK